MTTAASPTSGARRTLPRAELERAMALFSDISESLRSGFSELAERAERVERELGRANAELEAKIAELDAVKRHLEAVLAALPTGVVVRDAAGRISRINGAALSILGAEEDAPRRLGHGSTLPPAPADGAGSTLELERPDGTRRVLWTACSPIRSADGAVLGSVQILDDRTRTAALAERLHSQSKLAALGTMAAGIAHEIRNPMNAVAGFAGLLVRDLEPGTRARRYAERIVTGSVEVDAIVAGVLGFAKPQTLELEPVDPEELLEGALRALLPEAGAPSAWTVHRVCCARPFLGDRIKLRQAVRNLVSNALDVQPDGGEVAVSLLEERGEVVVRVCDAGPGIPEAIRGAVLDPFFTTRAEGTGLGLALTQTIAELHGGRVVLSKEPSPLGGADVSLRFPLTPANDTR